MQIKQLDHLNLDVADLAASADWYRRVFGFEEQERGIYNGYPWRIVRSGEAMLAMYERPGLTVNAGSWAESQALAINHFALRITDKAAWLATIEREAIKVNYGEAVEWPHSTSWYLNDPNGYEIEVVLWIQDQIRFAA